MIAFHGDPATKEKYIARVRAHREADRLVQGFTWESGKGCAVGCTLEAYEHERYPSELGVPEEIAYLQDSIFESLTPKEAQEFPEQFLEAIPIGADLSLVWNRFAVWMLVDPKHGVIRFAEGEVSRAVIQGVANLHMKAIEGRQVSHDAWDAASSAAAAAGAADAASYAADADAGAAARHAQRDELLRLLRGAPLDG